MHQDLFWCSFFTETPNVNFFIICEVLLMQEFQDFGSGPVLHLMPKSIEIVPCEHLLVSCNFTAFGHSHGTKHGKVRYEYVRTSLAAF